MMRLPELGARETPQIEFKAELAKQSGGIDFFELAKDVAAFASSLGGTIIVGAIEDRRTGQLLRFKPMLEQEAQAVVAAYDTAIASRCVPVPLIASDVFAQDTGYVVAIHVQPVLDRVVAVRVEPVPAERFGNGTLCAYVFPVRLGTHAIAFTPEQTVMLLNPQLRRIALLLESIPTANRADCVLCWEPFRRSATDVATIINSRCALELATDRALADIDGNAATFTLVNAQGQRQGQLVVPLDDIETVWRDDSNKWCVRLSGWIEGSPGRSTYHTRRGRL